MSNAITVTNLRKVFKPEKKGGKSFVAVNGISLAVREGEILGLLGPNGAGKSTTIFMLLGVLSPTSGGIIYGDKNFFTHRQEIMQGVTFASTYIKMPWRLTVMENLRVYSLMYGLEYSTFRVRVEKFLKFFGVWNQRDKTLSQLSAGQITRVMLAKAFIPHPKVVLLDEPTASLDPDIAHEVRQFVLKQQQAYNTSILYTSHNMDEVTAVCNRVVFLRNGEIIATDTPDKLAASVSLSHMKLQVKDGLKRTERFAKEKGLEAKVVGREIEIAVDDQQIAAFLEQLAGEKIKYTAIEISKPTLEDYFLLQSAKQEKKT